MLWDDSFQDSSMNIERGIEGQSSPQSFERVSWGKLWSSTVPVVCRHKLSVLLAAVAVLVFCLLSGAYQNIWKASTQVCRMSVYWCTGS